MTTFDPTVYKETTREQWQAAEIMLDLADVQIGSRMLDVAAGAGEQTLTAARRVGPEGYVLATDIAPNLLEYVRKDAWEARLTNVETRVVDGETLARQKAGGEKSASLISLLPFDACASVRCPNQTATDCAYPFRDDRENVPPR